MKQFQTWSEARYMLSEKLEIVGLLIISLLLATTLGYIALLMRVIYQSEHKTHFSIWKPNYIITLG